MRISFLGHASLLIEGYCYAVLFDPILGDTLGHGSNELYPRRRIDPARLPPLSTLVISHRHNDHFDVPSLARIREFSNPIILIPDDSMLEECLKTLGYSYVRRLKPFELQMVEGLSIMATPSSVNVPELGFILADEDGVVWNQVDTHFEPFVDEVVSRVGRSIDVALVPYQSGTFNEYIPLLGNVMSKETVNDLRAEARRWLQTLMEAIEVIRPKVTIPFANGICYPREVEVMNSLHFVTPDESFVDAIMKRVPKVRSRIPHPGLSIDLVNSIPRITDQPARCLTHIDMPSTRRQFCPANRLETIIHPLLPATSKDLGIISGNLLNQVKESALLFGEQGIPSFIEQGRKIERAIGTATWCLAIDGLETQERYALHWRRGKADFEPLLKETVQPCPEMRLHVNDLIGLLENRVELCDLVMGARVRAYLPDGITVSNENVNSFCFNPAWFALGHQVHEGQLVERHQLLLAKDLFDSRASLSN
jgi:L-ascorbate metabolism protein UlaG (beta-lactamase superfamily)